VGAHSNWSRIPKEPRGKVGEGYCGDERRGTAVRRAAALLGATVVAVAALAGQARADDLQPVVPAPAATLPVVPVSVDAAPAAEATAVQATVDSAVAATAGAV